MMLTRFLFLAPLLASTALGDRPIDGDTSIIAHTGDPVGTEEVVDGSQCGLSRRCTSLADNVKL